MSLVQCMSDEAVRWDAGEYDAGEGAAKGAVAEVLEANPQLRA